MDRRHVLLIIVTLLAARYSYVRVCDNMKCNFTIVQQQCSGFVEGKVTGPLCQDLCNATELKIERCLASRPDKKVFEASWKGKLVILKAEEYSITKQGPSHLSTEEATRHIAKRVQFLMKKQFGRCVQCQQVTSRFVQHADGNGDGTVTAVEAMNFQSLILNHEVFMVILLNGNKHSVDFHGYCGKMYAVEKVSVNARSIFGSATAFHEYLIPEMFGFDELLQSVFARTLKPLFASMNFLNTIEHFSVYLGHVVYRYFYEVRVPSVEEKFKLINSVLDVLVTLCGNPYGLIQWCDAHIANYGVTKDSVVKIFDYDEILGRRYVETLLAKRQCETGCRVGQSCNSHCIKSTGNCSAQIIDQDLQTACNFIVPIVFRNHYLGFGAPEARLRCQFKVLENVRHRCGELPAVRNVKLLKKNFELVKRWVKEAQGRYLSCTN